MVLFICPYEVSLVFPLPPCILLSRPLFEFVLFLYAWMSHAPYLLFWPFFYRRNFSEFGRIHLKFSLPFHTPYLLPISLSLIHLSGSTGSLRPLLILASITRPLHINDEEQLRLVKGTN